MFNVHKITQSEITWSPSKKAVVRKLEEQAGEKAGWTLPVGPRPAESTSLSLRRIYTILVRESLTLRNGRKPGEERKIKLHGRC